MFKEDKGVEIWKLWNKLYLTGELLTKEERTLLVSLRSQCHNSKSFVRKMNQNSVKCVFGCNTIEDQEHAFTKCQPILSKIADQNKANYDLDIVEQKVQLKCL